MKLISLKLKDFQGIEEGFFEFDGKDAFIHGNNGTGKTTVFNAYTWLLFGKASTDEKGYSPKTLTKDGKPVHKKKNSAKGVFELKDGSRITLEKVYEEVWKKKRNAPKAEFSGHRTTHHINDVPVSATEYKEKISGLTSHDDEIIKILTMPHYFAGALAWQKRRSILLDVFGNITDEEVFKKNNRLSELKGYLEVPNSNGQRHSVEEFIRMANSQINGDEGLKNRLRKKGDLLDELQDTIQDTKVDQKPLVTTVKRLKQELAELEDKAGNHRQANLNELRVELGKETVWLAGMETRVKNNQRDLSHAKEKLSDAVSSDKFTCSACGQMLPFDEAERRRNKQIEIAEDRIKSYEKVLEKSLQEADTTKAKIKTLKKAIEKAEKETNSDNDLERALEKARELSQTESQLAVAKSNAEQVQRQKARIKELAQEQEAIAKEYEVLLRGLDLCEQFTASKARYLEDAVNSKLKHLQVRFFEQQVNGGYAEACDILVPTATGGHVPYQSANTAGKLNAGLELINILSNKWDCRLPVFLDKAEGVTEIIGTDFQLIGLVVDKECQELDLRVVRQGNIQGGKE